MATNNKRNQAPSKKSNKQQEKIPAINDEKAMKKVCMAMDSNELGKGGKGNEEKWWREEKAGMATDSDRLESIKLPAKL